MTATLKIFLVCLLLLTSTSCHYFARWRGPCSIWPLPPPEGGTPVTRDFSSAEGRFRIGLPGREDIPGAEPYKNDKTFKWFIINQAQFQIVYVDRETLVDTPENSQAILAKAREISSSRGKLTADSEISASGHPGREFRMETEGGTQIDRIYLAGNRVYLLNVFVPKSWHCKVPSAVKVLDTFEITG